MKEVIHMFNLLRLQTIAISLLIVGTVLQPVEREMIVRVESVSLEYEGYWTQVVDEDDNEWVVLSDRNLSNEWLVCNVSNNSTKTLEDDIITNFSVVKDE